MKTSKHNSGLVKDVIIKSIITCPQCEYRKEELVPVDACSIFMSVTNVKEN